MKFKTKLITIYLPQFHTIPENDKWWGKGFTEWTNVKRGRPFYFGHYQPRIPLKNNYYDLSNLKVLERHTQMAKKAGIYGFAFYQYYFSGKKLLEKPIENYRDYSKEEFPYCLIWANQSWARTWYRANIGEDVLLKQEYGEKKDWKIHFEYLLTYFKDPRYIKINNKPVYIIYLPQDIESRKEIFKYWNELAILEGFSGLYLIAMNTGWGADKAYNLYDAYMNFEPIRTMSVDLSWRNSIDHIKEKYVENINIKKSKWMNYLYARNTYTYQYLCAQIEKGYCIPSNTKTIFGTFSGWDNSSRKDEAGIIVRNSTPKRFGVHIKRMLELSEKKKNEFLFLNVWNEWSEGAYIEPDERFKEAYLRALRRAVYLYEER